MTNGWMRGENDCNVLWKKFVIFISSYFFTRSKIELEEKYKNQTCGLCGDYNGVSGDFINPGKSGIVYFKKCQDKAHLQTVWTSITLSLALRNRGERDTGLIHRTVENGRRRRQLWGRRHQTSRGLWKRGALKIDAHTHDVWAVTDASLIRLRSHRQLVTCKDFFVKKALKSCQKVVDTPAFLKACTIDLRYKNSSSVSNLCSTMAEFSHQCAHAGGKPKAWLKQLCGKEKRKTINPLKSRPL